MLSALSASLLHDFDKTPGALGPRTELRAGAQSASGLPPGASETGAKKFTE